MRGLRTQARLATLLALASILVIAALPSHSSAALTVEHSPPASVSTGVPIHVEVTVTADAPVQRVEVLPVTYSAFENFTLTLVHGTATYGVWEGDIPPQSRAGFLEYRVEVTRADSWTQDYDYNVTVTGGTTESGGLDLPENAWVLFVAGIIILAIFFILEIPLKRRLMERLDRRSRRLESEKGGAERKARRVKKD